MSPRDHIKILRLQDGSNSGTNPGGQAEESPRFLRREWETSVVECEKVGVRCAEPFVYAPERSRRNIRHRILCAFNVEGGEWGSAVYM